MGNPNIGIIGKATQMKKGETRNPNGQPRKGVSLVNKELQDMGYKPANKQDIIENYMNMVNLKQKELTLLAKDDSKPMLVRIIAKNMLGGKGFDIIEKMLDRGLGKPTQMVEGKMDGELVYKVKIEM